MGLIGKKPFLWDETEGRVGTYVGTREATREGYVIIQYIPLNSPKVNTPVEFDEPVPKDAIITIEADHPDKPGVQGEYKVVTERADGERPFIDQVRKQREKMISDMREQVRQEQIEKEQHKEKRVKTQQGQQELQKEEEKSKKNKGRNRDRFDMDEW